MLWRHLCLARAWSAAGLLLGGSLIGPVITARADSDEQAPRPVAATETVSVLDARKAGDLAVEVRGAGQDRVKMTLKNTSNRRLNIVVPPGLVASSTAGQRGGGFQSMGLGSVSNKPGSFGEFRSTTGPGSGLQAVVPTDRSTTGAVTVPAGQAVELSVVSVCLNFGVATPTPRDRFELVDVDDYSNDVRVRRALRSLATYGTSQGTAQAAMWRVCNDVPFELMVRQAGKVMNSNEIALAARFVEALDSSTATELVDPAYLRTGRILVRVTGEGGLAQDASRLSREVEGLRLLGLPVQAYEEGQAVLAPSMLVNVVLTNGQTGETRGRILLSQANFAGQWSPIGKAPFTETSTSSVLDGATLLRAVDRTVSANFVTMKPARRGVGTTTFRVDNRLPFTIARMTVRAGDSSGAPVLDLNGLGIAPARSSQVSAETPVATVEHVEFNGL